MDAVTHISFGLVFLLILSIIIFAIKLGKAKKDLARFSVIIDAEAEASKIIKDANAAAKKNIDESEQISKEASKTAKKTISDAEEEAKKINKEAAASASKLSREAAADAEKMNKDATKSAEHIIDSANEVSEGITANAHVVLKELKEEQITLLEDLESLRMNFEKKSQVYNRLKEAAAIYEEDEGFLELGFYKPHFDFDSSENFMLAIKKNREKQKALLKEKSEFGAVYCATEWTINNSKAEGRKLATRGVNLAARAFNAECDAAINACTFKNVNKMEERIEKAFDKINELNSVNQIHITHTFLELKIEELFLHYEYQEKKQSEKEEQRELRAQIREEERAQREIDRAIQEAEEEERRAQKALNQARREMERKLKNATEEQAAMYNEKIAQLEADLAEAESKGQRALSMAQQTKRGHVYIISNIGSFGENVFKIGMTRRLDPQDRVDELGSASVPFLFDVHAMIRSEDAPALENALHQYFDGKRTNAINRRKEFFNVSLDEVKNVVYQLAGKDVDFVETIVAQHYRETLALRKEQNKTEMPAAPVKTFESEFAEAV